MICTVDTDVIVILIGQFYSYCKLNPRADIRVAFGIGKQFRYYVRNWEDTSLCPFKVSMLLLDVTVRLLFFGKSKKSAWATWVSYPDATETFLHFATHSYEPINCMSPHFSILEIQ